MTREIALKMGSGCRLASAQPVGGGSDSKEYREAVSLVLVRLRTGTIWCGGLPKKVPTEVSLCIIDEAR